MRSQIIKVVKELTEQKPQSESPEDALTNIPISFAILEVRTHHNARYQPILNDEQVKDLLVELSSPLAGYLGRNKDKDTFYFLRDLETPSV